jgi:lipopolysaccharide biosynthesis glycosyltransferase
MDEVNLIYSANDKFFNQIFLSVLSILEKSKAKLNIYILTMDYESYKTYNKVNQNQIDLLNKTIKSYNNENTIKLIDMKDLFNQYFSSSKKENKDSSFTPYCLLRLLSDKIRDIPDKILYLDTDTMCYNDITKLYNIDIDNYEYGAVKDVVGKYFFGQKYINSGVLLLNIKKIKETKLFDKCLDYLKRKISFMPDQDALNYCAKSKKILNNACNEQRKIKKDTIIKHFCNIPILFGVIKVKQSNIENVHKKLKIYEFDDIYEKYMKINRENNFILDKNLK